MFSLKRCKLPNKSLCCFCSPTLRILFACLVSVIQIPCWLYRICSTSLDKIPSFSSVSYSERLKRLKFDNLELRRLYIDLTLCFKVCNGYVALAKNDFFAFNPLRRTRDHCFKNSYFPYKRTSALRCSPSYSCLDILTNNCRQCIFYEILTGGANKIIRLTFNPLTGLTFPKASRLQ